MTTNDGPVVLDGISDVPWADREGSTYTMTRDATLDRLVIAEGVTLTGRHALRVDELVNHGTIYGEVVAVEEFCNEGHVDPESMRPWQ